MFCHFLFIKGLLLCGSGSEGFKAIVSRSTLKENFPRGGKEASGTASAPPHHLVDKDELAEGEEGARLDLDLLDPALTRPVEL